MRVLHVITRIENSGPNKVLIALAKGQRALGAEVTVASLQPDRDDPEIVADLIIQGIEVGGGLSKGQRADARWLTALSSDFSVTHVHCLRSLYIAVRARVHKLVVTSHNIPDEDWPHAKGPILGWAVGQLHYFLMKRADKVAAINERMRSRIAARGGDVVLMRNPASLSEVPNPTPLKAPHKLLCVGHLNSRKNQGLLLEALALLGPSARGLRLDLLGDGPLRPELAAQAKDLQCEIRFIGYVADPTPWFREADLYVSPALSEGQPIAVLEAMGYGLPCLLSDISGHSFPDAPPGSVQIFANNAAALAEALSRIIATPSPCPPALTASWARESFAPAAVAGRYLNLYRQLFEREQI